MRAPTVCDPQIWCAAAAAAKIDRNDIDLTRRPGLRVYLIDPTERRLCGARLRRIARGAFGRHRRPP